MVVLALAAVALALLRGGPDGTDVRAMAPGQCYVETDVVQDHGRPIPQGRDTPCLTTSPRIVAVVPMPLGPFPANTDFDAVVEGHCGDEQDFVVLPTEESWLAGDRIVVCIASPRSDPAGSAPGAGGAEAAVRIGPPGVVALGPEVAGVGILVVGDRGGLAGGDRVTAATSRSTSSAEVDRPALARTAPGISRRSPRRTAPR